MPSLNKVMIIGHLGRDPELKYMPNGDAVTNFSVATSESWKDKNTGEKKEQTEWHRITCYRKLAEIAGQYLKTGSTVYVEGKITTRKWKDKQGIERYTTEIIANELKMFGGNKKPAEPAAKSHPTVDMDSDIPFSDPYKGRLSYVV